MKGWIKCIIAGAVILGIGIAVLLITLACNGWSLKKPEFEMQTYTATENNTAIDISVGAGSVSTEFYDGDKIVIEYPSASVFKSVISEKEGVLHYKSKVRRALFWSSLDIPNTVIKLPEAVRYDLEFEVNAGSVIIASGSYGKVDIEVHAGKLTVSQSQCSVFDCEVNAGLLEVNALSCEKFECDVSAGKLEVKTLDCPDINADVSAGMLVLDVNGVKADYDIRANVSAGSCNVSNQTVNGGKKLDVDCSAGTIKVTFAG